MAQLEVQWTLNSLEDLESARIYLLENSPQFLEGTIEIILDGVEHLKSYPEIGRLGRVKGTRELILNPVPFILIYRKNKRVIEIISLLHQSKKWR